MQEKYICEREDKAQLMLRSCNNRIQVPTNCLRVPGTLRGDQFCSHGSKSCSLAMAANSLSFLQEELSGTAFPKPNQRCFRGPWVVVLHACDIQFGRGISTSPKVVCGSDGELSLGRDGGFLMGVGRQSSDITFSFF